MEDWRGQEHAAAPGTRSGIRLRERRFAVLRPVTGGGKAGRPWRSGRAEPSPARWRHPST